MSAQTCGSFEYLTVRAIRNRWVIAIRFSKQPRTKGNVGRWSATLRPDKRWVNGADQYPSLGIGKSSLRVYAYSLNTALERLVKRYDEEVGKREGEGVAA